MSLPNPGGWKGYGPDAARVAARGEERDDAAPVRAGHVVGGAGWFDPDYLGIDQGPILAMIENHRSGFVWRVMRRNPHVQRGLFRAGFRGGWLEAIRQKPAA